MPIPDKDLVYTGSRDPRRGEPSITERTVKISVGRAELVGDLAVPEQAQGFVLFAHGSGSSRHSPRNRYMAKELQRAYMATLLVDLLTLEEEQIDVRTREFRFNIDMLGERLIRLTDWHSMHPDVSSLPMGYFGASTGSAAALIAAAARADLVRAVVSRGGRPDLARASLPGVKAPTLLIVGGSDAAVIELNQQAFQILPGRKTLEIIPGATHLFQESGALEQVARLAAEWYGRYLAGTESW
jgi:putative phosphoribosyl transferase